MCNVVVEHTGQMLWVPPAIYKSSCIIDVEYFPVRSQFITLKCRIHLSLTNRYAISCLGRGRYASFFDSC